MTMLIDLPGEQGADTVRNALAAYKARLEQGQRRGRRRLSEFERRYGVSTEHFLKEMTAEDLAGGDLEYVEWAGEAKVSKGVESELKDLEHVHLRLR